MGVFIFNCPHCGKQIGAQDEWEGKTTMCPHCQKPVVIRHEMPNMPPNGMPQPTMSAWGDYSAGPPEVCKNAKNSMWFGLASICCCHICGIIAVVLGILGLNEIKQSDGRLEGKTYAWIGIALGGMQVIIMIINLIYAPRLFTENRKLMEKLMGPRFGLEPGQHIEQIEEVQEMPVKPLPEPKTEKKEDVEPEEKTKPVEREEPIKDLPPAKRPRPDEVI